jgi:tetratricopeptide (TPR) repeat protein
MSPKTTIGVLRTDTHPLSEGIRDSSESSDRSHRTGGKKFISCFLLATYYLLLSTCCFALDSPFWQSKGRAGYPGEYLITFTANARAAGLANAYTALSDDASGAYWNPAGLAGIHFIETSFLYTRLFLHTDYGYLSFVYPLDERNIFGLSVLALQSAEVEKTSQWSLSGVKFHELENVFFLTYAKKFNSFIDGGLNLKIVNQEIADYSTRGVGMDLGVKYHFSKRITYGLTLQNLIPAELQLNEEKENFPLNIKFGIICSYLKNRLLWSSDLNLLDPFGKYKVFYWSSGVEYKIFPLFVLRVGISYKEIAAGFGLKTNNFNFDYAVSLHRIDLTHRLSVAYRYGFLPYQEEKRLKEEKETWQKEKKADEEKLDGEKKKILLEKERIAKEQEITTGLILVKKYLEEKNYQEAQKELERILTLDPTNKEAKILNREVDELSRKDLAEKSYFLAKNFYEKKFYSRVLETLKKALEYYPEHEKAKILYFLAQGQVYLAERKYSEAKEAFFEVLKLDPKEEEATTLLRRLQTILEFYPSEGQSSQKEQKQ